MAGLIGTVGMIAALTVGCAPPQSDGPASSARVDVDTPELRALREKADLEPCRPGPRSGASKLPKLTLPCLGGGQDVDLSTLKGPMLINVWASWCAPCRREMPILQSFHEKYGEKLPVLGIDFEDRIPAEALSLARETGVTYPLLADPGASIRGADPIPAFQGIPLQLIVDTQGEVHPVNKEVTSLREVEQLVEKYADLPEPEGRG